jgi:mannose-6-phosphate isomerase-like protein (cupin superfamily)
MEPKHGIYLNEKHARLIVEGKKTLILQDHELKDYAKEPLYLLTKENVYGVIQLKDGKKLAPSMYEQLRDQHQVTPEEFKKWWPDGVTLWGYGFDIKSKFDPPKTWKFKPSSRNIVTNVEIHKVDGIDQPPYVDALEQQTKDNMDFRHILYTTKENQLVLMCLKPLEDIGQEVHKDVTQFFRIEEGEGKAILNNVEYPLHDGMAVIVPAGTQHNVVNLSDEKPLKLYTIYSPPEHPADEAPMTDKPVAVPTAGYQATKIDNEKLIHDWKLVSKWYRAVKEGKTLKYSESQIVEFAKAIYQEVVNRITLQKMEYDIASEDIDLLIEVVD